MKIFSLLPVLMVLMACSSDATVPSEPIDTASSTIYWSDGDSGVLNGLDFRLRDVDAPETGGVNAAIGGAECERERERGYAAKQFIVSLTENASLEITKHYGLDRYDRAVVDINADGIDVASAGVEAGHLEPWPHDNDGNSLAAKPDWCS